MPETNEFYYEFYNAGDRIDEHMRFSISASSAGFNSDDNSLQSCGFWRLDAPKESFFKVPAEISSGQEVMRVNFADDIKRRFGTRGVVLIDKKWNPENEDPDTELSQYPMAPTREAAIERGNALWQIYIRKIVEGHLADCQNAMAAGGAPRAASGFTKRAFKLLGVADPGEQYFQGLKEAGKHAASNETSALLLQIQQQNQAMMAVVLAVASGQKIDPDLLKALVTVPAAKIPLGQPTSFVATGEVKKPIGEFSAAKAGLDVYDRKTQGRKERAQAAEKELTTS
jgi:hypothetical protein